MNVKLKVWRQKNNRTPGEFVEYDAKDIPADASFLEMLDIVNDHLTTQGIEPIAFDHDCREGICGSCSLVINGIAHGPGEGKATCQLYMRHFHEGQTILIEPFRAQAFPLIKDLIVNRKALDRIIAAGGFVTVRAGAAPDGNAVPIPKQDADTSMDAAACIGCGACVAACPNASAMLFVSAKVSQLALLPQGQPERRSRVLSMVKTMDESGFGNCRNYFECEAVCPAKISGAFIGRMNREYSLATLNATVTSTT